MNLAELRQSDFFRLRPEVKMAAWLALGLAILVVCDQIHYWQSREDFSFGYLVPVFVGYVLYDRWPLLKKILLGDPATQASSGAPNSWEGFWNFFATVAVICSLLLFSYGGFLRAVTGPDTDSASAIGMGFGVFALAMGFLVSRMDAQGKIVTLSARGRVVAMLVFPALAWLISAPMLLVFETRVKPVLLERVVRIVSYVYGTFLALPVYREGSVLVLPNGRVGVADACSGIRSLTACLFAGSFLSAVFLDRFWKKVLLLILSAMLAFVMNIGRSLFLTGWAYQYGSEALDADFWLQHPHIKDAAGNFVPNPQFHFITVHDFAGYAVLGFTLAGLLLLLPLLNFKFEIPDEAPPASSAAPEKPATEKP